MLFQGHVWSLESLKAALVRRDRTWDSVGNGMALVEVLGCGVCHTDLGFADGDVAPKQALPLVLGHEIVGRVLAVGEGASPDLIGKRALVPAVSPCGACAFCQRGRVTACAKGRMPGNDADGGFATHCAVPARDLAVLDSAPGAAGKLGKAGLDPWELAPVADAGTTAYQALVRAKLAAGDVAIFVGVGGVGGFGVQLAAARGAHVVGLDIDDRRLEGLGSSLAHSVNARGREARDVRESIRGFIKTKGLRDAAVRIFETSGTPAGQSLAFQLLERGGSLSVVGFTPEKVQLRLSNVMALDAELFGNWGCDPALYGEVLEFFLSGLVDVRAFVERHPLDDVNRVLDAARGHLLSRRAVLVPNGG